MCGDPAPSGWRRTTAWGVHAFTALGAVCCLLALGAAAESDWRRMFAWLAVAVTVDALDGTLARAAKVKQVLPHFDGTMLDSIIDYVSYVLVPAFAIGRSQLMPPSLAWPVASLVCLASAYQFCQTDAKTEDHFFKGFPSYWNIVIFYLFIWQLQPLANSAIVLALIVLVFVPIKYVYPTRTATWRTATLVLSALWGATIGAMLWLFPRTPLWLANASLAYIAYYIALSVYLTATGGGRRDATR